jgi:DNA-binding NarL/FixJ family response regulator
MADTGRIDVWIIEDHAGIRNSLAVLIDGTPGFTSTGSFGSMEAALARLAVHTPDVALVDIGLPGMSGTEGVRKLHQQSPRTSSVVLTVYDDDERIMEALCAGANGYLLKNTPPARILEAVRESNEGGSPMSPQIARRVVELFRRVQPPEAAEYRLTPYELRILDLLVQGENNKTAAGKLGVKMDALSYHVRHIYEKLHVHSRSEAVAKALRSGLFR